MDKTEFIIAIVGIIVSIGVIATAFIILFYQQHSRKKRELKERIFMPKILSINLVKAIKTGSKYSMDLLEFYSKYLPRIGLILKGTRLYTYRENFISIGYTGGGKLSLNSKDVNAIIKDVKDYIKEWYNLDLGKMTHEYKEI